MAAGDLTVSAGTPIIFGSEVADDVDWSTESIADDAGRQSAQHDLGAAARTIYYKVRFYCQCVATPTVGAPINLYLKTADAASTHLDNDDGTGDAAVSNENKLLNLHYVGSAYVDEAAANIEYVLSVPEIIITARYIHAVLFNKAGSALTSDVAETKLELTPLTYNTEQ